MVISNRTKKALSLEKIVIVLLVTLFVWAVGRNAWLYDDAYITFRTVDNFVNGYGLTWNTAERVQTYTHPLWMFLVSGVYFITREIFFSSLFLSLAISIGVVLILAFGLAKSTPAALLGLTILTFSKAFVDYSTSGLENPLTHLLLALFLLIYLRVIFSSRLTFNNLFWLALLTALGALNRMDTILLFLPGLGYTWWLACVRVTAPSFHRPYFRQLVRGLLVILAGFTPFIIWEIFSLFYYGFPFPNTAYAKLNTDVNRLALAEQGLYYLFNSVQNDPLTLLTIVIGLILPLFARRQRRLLLPLAAGITLYLLYIIRIGGDFMSGRFLTGPLVVAVALLVNYNGLAAPGWGQRFIGRVKILAWGLLWGGILLIGLSMPYPPLLCNVNYGLSYEREELREQGVQDGRGIYYQYSGLLNALQNPQIEWPNHSWSVKGREARQQGPAVIERGAIGFFGFYAGPHVHIIDRWALADPLLARLPVLTDWQIGHFTRRIPAGYLKTLESGQNQIANPALAAFYDKLVLATRGPLFDLNRFVEIWKLNTGQYNALLATYPLMVQVNLSQDRPATTPLWDKTDNLADYTGLQFNLGYSSTASQIEVHLAPLELDVQERREYQLIYFKEGTAVASQALQIPAQIPADGLVRAVQIPAEAVASGYDTIKIFPDRGDSLGQAIYGLTDVRLIE